MVLTVDPRAPQTTADKVSARLSGVPLWIRSLLASAAVVIIACLLYRYAPFSYQRRQFAALYGMGGFRFTGGEFLALAAAAYILLLAGFHAFDRNGPPSKALRVFRLVGGCLRSPGRILRGGMGRDERVALTATLLKMFFGPLMVMSLLAFCNAAIVNGATLVGADASSTSAASLGRVAFWFSLQSILFVDVLIFTVGYLVESPRLGNEIRSVETAPLGIAAALFCYPPFNSVTSFILGSSKSDFPQFDDPMVHVVLNVLLLLLMGTYTAASVAMGFKASNLTHRGIVDRGPYAVIRHPAYICKNAAWWIGSYPLVALHFGESLLSGIQTVATVIAWTALYALRAVTEEDHLKRVDGEYAAYAARVRYRFIPGVY